jgi:hypothetical protein
MVDGETNAVRREDRDRVRKRSKMRSCEAAERSKLSMETARESYGNSRSKQPR